MGRGWRPVALGAAIVVATVLLAQAAIFKPSVPAAASGTGGDVYRGEVVFERACATCHGAGGEGGDPGPRLVESGLDAAAIAAIVEQGRGVMPPAVVTGQDQADVVAYVASIAAP